MCMSTLSGVQNVAMQEEQAGYMAAVEAENARMAARQAEAVDLQGNQQRAQLHNKAQQERGAARASYAAGGVVLGSGTSADYEADIADAYDLDSRNLDYEIASKKWQLQVQSVNAANQSALYDWQRRSYKSQRPTSILNGIFSDIGSGISMLSGGVAVGKGIYDFSSPTGS